MDMSSFDTQDIGNRNNHNLSLREEVITFGSCMISGIGGTLLWGNAAKVVYSVAASTNFELSTKHNAVMATIGLVGGLMMNDMLHTADTLDEDYGQDD